MPHLSAHFLSSGPRRRNDSFFFFLGRGARSCFPPSIFANTGFRSHRTFLPTLDSVTFFRSPLSLHACCVEGSRPAVHQSFQPPCVETRKLESSSRLHVHSCREACTRIHLLVFSRLASTHLTLAPWRPCQQRERSSSTELERSARARQRAPFLREIGREYYRGRGGRCGSARATQSERESSPERRQNTPGGE